MFEKTPAYVINIAKRTERWAQTKEVLESLGASNVHRVDAVVMSPGFMGCSHSHLKMWSAAEEAGHNWIFGLEDDIMLAPGVTPADAKRRIEQVMAKFGDTMDAMFLAMTPIKLEKVPGMDGVVRVRRSFGTAGALLPRKTFGTWTKVAKEAIRTEKPIDVTLLNTMNKNRGMKVYGFFPPIFVQRPGFSDITNADSNYGYVEIEGRMLDEDTKKLFSPDEEDEDDNSKHDSKHESKEDDKQGDANILKSSGDPRRSALKISLICSSVSAAVLVIALVVMLLIKL